MRCHFRGQCLVCVTMTLALPDNTVTVERWGKTSHSHSNSLPLYVTVVFSIRPETLPPIFIKSQWGRCEGTWDAVDRNNHYVSGGCFMSSPTWATATETLSEWNLILSLCWLCQPAPTSQAPQTHSRRVSLKCSRDQNKLAPSQLPNPTPSTITSSVILSLCHSYFATLGLLCHK